VFLSADKGYPEKLEQAGKTEGSPVQYARGRLVIWVPNTSSLKLPSKGDQTLEGNLDVLTTPAVRKIAIANPEHAPYGRAAVAALTHFGVYDQVKPKIVLGENISQTAQFGQSGNADVTLISLSLASTGSLQKDGHWLLLPEESYPPIDQAGVVLKSSQNKEHARRFLDFISSPAGQAIMHDFGFGAGAK
jgi:molybdate transport system substrate-binding protein